MFIVTVSSTSHKGATKVLIMLSYFHLSNIFKLKAT